MKVWTYVEADWDLFRDDLESITGLIPTRAWQTVEEALKFATEDIYDSYYGDDYEPRPVVVWERRRGGGFVFAIDDEHLVEVFAIEIHEWRERK
jgi:hypothetical protein